MAKKQEPKKAKVNKALEGLDFNVSPLGQIQANIDIQKINAFLNETVKDKKFEKAKKKDKKKS